MADENIASIHVGGVGMRTHTGVAERMFAALAAEHINVKMITTADIKISALVNKSDGLRALRAVHQAFDLAKARPGAGLKVEGPLLPPPSQHRDLAGLTKYKIESLTMVDLFPQTFHLETIVQLRRL